MKIFYDISVLGSGQYNPLARTGVARVVENLAAGLLNYKECNLIFCESISIHILSGCLAYLASHPKFKGIPFAHSSFITVVCNKFLELYAMLNARKKNGDATNDGTEDKEIVLELMQSLENSLNLIEGYPYSLNPNQLSKADVYHATFFPIPERVRQVKDVNKIITIHDLIPTLYPQFCGDNEDVRISRTIDSIDPDTWVICVSNATKNDLCNHSKTISRDRLLVTYLAADPQMFYPCQDYNKITSLRKKYSIPDENYILGLSTLEPRKNLDHLIRCYAKVIQQQHIKDLSLVLVGNQGWKYKKILDELSNQHLLKDRIILTGRVADEELAALYSGALAFIYPSFYEGFGLPPLEAMQCGVPVITSNISSLPEVVGDAGILLDPNDTDGLCHSILEIYNRPSLRENMSLKSLEQAKKFSWKKCSQETIAVYKKALAS